MIVDLCSNALVLCRMHRPEVELWFPNRDSCSVLSLSSMKSLKTSGSSQISHVIWVNGGTFLVLGMKNGTLVVWDCLSKKWKGKVQLQCVTLEPDFCLQSLASLDNSSVPSRYLRKPYSLFTRHLYSS